MYKYNNRYLAQCSYNFEEYTFKELEEFGVKSISKTRGGVYFNADFEQMMYVNYNIRTANRILMIVKEFYWKDEKHLYNEIKNIEWKKYFLPDKTIAVYNITDKKYVKNSKIISLITKDAICDKFRIYYNKRPNVEKNNPNIRIFVYINRSKVSVSIDTSGESLDKRGYRIKAGDAPIRETLASAMILESKWKGEKTLIDFMCGSGTIPIEASLIATNTPPQIIRKEFSFYYLRDFDSKIWLKVKQKSKNKIIELKNTIYASDIDKYLINIAIENSKRIFMFENIDFSISDYQKVKIIDNSGVIIINPPYGKRLKHEYLRDFYIQLNKTLKRSFKNWTLFMIADSVSHGFLGLKASKKVKFFNGPLEVYFNKYEIR